MPWYIFTGPEPAIGTPDPFDPSHYTFAGDVQPAVEQATNTMCAIYTRDNRGLPLITGALHWEIIIAIVNHTSTENVRLKF